MSKIIAKRKDSTVTVEEKDGTITVLFDGVVDSYMQYLLDRDGENAPPMGGTFYPDHGTMLFYYNTLKHLSDTVSVEGDIGEIPHEEDGVIY